MMTRDNTINNKNRRMNDKSSLSSVLLVFGCAIMAIVSTPGCHAFVYQSPPPSSSSCRLYPRSITSFSSRSITTNSVVQTSPTKQRRYSRSISSSSPLFLSSIPTTATSTYITNANKLTTAATNTTTATTLNQPSSSSSSHSQKARLAMMMAFITGWANLTIFTKFQTFATMVTGNTMWLALAITDSRYRDVAYYGSIIISYLAGTALFRNIELSSKYKKNVLPITAGIVALLFGIGDWIHYHSASSTTFGVMSSAMSSFLSLPPAVAAAPKWLPMILLATSFGIINSVGQEVTGTLTFVLTGHFTRLSNLLVDRVKATMIPNPLQLLRRRRDDVPSTSSSSTLEPMTEAQRTAMIQNSAVSLGFFAGSSFGCVLLRRLWLHQYGILSAIGLSYAAVWLAHDITTIGGSAWWLRSNQVLCDDVEDDGNICLVDDDDDQVEIIDDKLTVEVLAK